MEFNQNSELIQVIRKIVEFLLRTKQTKLKKFLFTKDKKVFTTFIEQTVKKSILSKDLNKLLEDFVSKNNLTVPKSFSNNLGKIIMILLPMKDEKLKMLYQVIKIITLINQPSDLSSFISSNEVLTVSNSSDFLSVPQDFQEKMESIYNNINTNDKRKNNINDFVSVKSFESEKQNFSNLMKLEEIRKYMNNNNLQGKMINNKRKHPDHNRDSIVSIDKNSSNNTHNSDEISSTLSEINKNILNQQNSCFFPADIKKNINNLYCIDKCLLPFDNLSKVPPNSNHKKGVKEDSTPLKRVFDFSEYSSASDADPLLIISEMKDKNIKMKQSNKEIDNNFIIEKNSKDVNLNNNNFVNTNINKSPNIQTNSVKNKQFLQLDDFPKQIINTNGSLSLPTHSFIYKNGPYTNESQISRATISNKLSLNEDERYTNQINFKSPPNVNKQQLKEEFENTAKMLNLKLPPPIVMLNKKK